MKVKGKIRERTFSSTQRKCTDMQNLLSSTLAPGIYFVLSSKALYTWKKLKKKRTNLDSFHKSITYLFLREGQGKETNLINHG
jgi:hypothetical protein